MPPNFPLPSSVLHSSEIADYPVLNISHPQASARVAIHGAHLLDWTPQGHAPVLYLSPQAIFHEGKAVRGGIPLCWPWFGPHEHNTNLPAHGFVRNRFWTLSEAQEDLEGVSLKFSMEDSAETQRLWPHPFHLEMSMHVGQTLKLALRMQNTGTESFTITAALHSYLALSDIRQVTVLGLEGAEYLDTVGVKKVHRQEGEITFMGEVDRDYRSSAEVHVHDAVLHRTLRIRGSGSQCTVVWNPWVEKAKALSDLPDEDYQRFVCVETANAWDDRITIEPGASHKLAAVIDVISSQ